MNIEKSMELYVEKLHSMDFTLNTILNYKLSVKGFLEYFKLKETPNDVSLEELKEYLDLYKSTNTKYSKLNAIKSFYRILEIKTIDFETFNMPKRVKVIPKHIPRVFLLDKIDEIDNRKHKALLTLAYGTGMWLSEMLDLELTDIDFEKNKIIIRNNKNTNKKRVVTFSNEVKGTLLRYIKKYMPIQYLFNGQTDLKYNKKSALCIIKKNIGEEYTFNLLRNSHIYALIESGNNMKYIQKHLGYGKEGIKRLKYFEKNTVKTKNKLLLMPI